MLLRFYGDLRSREGGQIDTDAEVRAADEVLRQLGEKYASAEPQAAPQPVDEEPGWKGTAPLAALLTVILAAVLAGGIIIARRVADRDAGGPASD